MVTPGTVDDGVLEATRVALGAGAPLVQVRSKAPSDRQRWVDAVAIQRLCAASGARCVVNDRADVAQAVSAHGVHVGDDDLPVPVVRRILGPGAVVGVTCRDVDAARRAVDEGASYLGVGPAYTTTTKAGLPDPLGPAGISRVAAAVSVPVIAIAGVDATRVPELLDAGAHGVAVVNAVFAAVNPAAAVAELLSALGEAP